ncbi:MAG: cell division protein FtsA [Candidatus Omnitrophica bacterium]|nr:cell division protein FtsA [Candidatus Omnitrophota bacterium]
MMNKENIYCGLDIGAQRIKACLIRVRKDQSLEIMGVSQVATSGLRKSSVSDLNNFSDSINRVVFGLTEKAKVKVREVHLGIGGHFIQGRKTHTVIPLADKGNKVITSFDIKKINHQACLLGVNLDEKLIHDFPIQYVVDDFNVSSNPLGLHGRKLEASILIAVAQGNLINNIYKAVQQAGFEVRATAFSSLCAAEACLTEEEKKTGCVFLDIGAQATDILIFKDGLLKNFLVLNFGGDQLTEEIARVLNLPFDLAEDIKRSYAMVVQAEGLSSVKGEILVKRDTGYVTLDRLSICNVVTPWAEMLVEKICHGIRQFDLEHHLSSGVTVSGGGALLAGLLEHIEHKLSLSTRMAKIRLDARHLNNPAVYAASIGLASRISQESMSSLFSPQQQGSWVNKVKNRLRELYQEYF